MASLIPVLLATVLSISVQVFTGSVSIMLPFRGLGHGTRVRDSLMLPQSIGLFTTPSVSIRFLRHYHDPLPLLNGLLSLLSVVLVPVSSEAIKLELSKTCRPSETAPRPGPGSLAFDDLRVWAPQVGRNHAIVRSHTDNHSHLYYRVGLSSTDLEDGRCDGAVEHC